MRGHSDALVLFGATGDLAYKKIFPALQAMIRRGRLPVPVIGVAKAGRLTLRIVGEALFAQDLSVTTDTSTVQLRDEVITMFIAGHETTALALTWTWHLLAGYPHVVAKLETELTQVLGDRAPTIEDVPKLTYTRMVVDEAMRVRPPVWTVARDVVADEEVGGYLVPAGSTVMLSQWVTHKRADFWPPGRCDGAPPASTAPAAPAPTPSDRQRSQ